MSNIVSLESLEAAWRAALSDLEISQAKWKASKNFADWDTMTKDRHSLTTAWVEFEDELYRLQIQLLGVDSAGPDPL